MKQSQKTAGSLKRKGRKQGGVKGKKWGKEIRKRRKERRKMKTPQHTGKTSCESVTARVCL